MQMRLRHQTTEARVVGSRKTQRARRLRQPIALE